MTRAQRRIVHTWVAVSALLLTVIVFESWILAQWSWLRFVAIVLILVGAAGAKPAGYGANWLDRAAERYPLLKLWFAVCAIAALGFFAATTIWNVRLDENIGIRGLVVMFVLILAPPMIVLERERFEEAGMQANES